MAKLVILDLQQDSLNQGVQVSVEIGNEERRPTFRETGFLPAYRPLFRILDQWRGSYRGLSISYRDLTLKTVQLSGSIQSRKDDCRQMATELQEQFQIWLRAETFRAVSNGLREKLDASHQIRILLRTDSPQLRQLPWQDWDLLDRYPGAEIILSASVSEQVSSARTQEINQQGTVRILAVLGNSQGIEVERDRAFLETFSSEAEICFLPQPTRNALHDALWDEHWDIFFFAGHSHTEGEQGVISLNDQEKLPLQDLKEGLHKAISNGLEIAIFNSCDGLGLARDLERLNIPQLIVMREPVPDQVAQQFLKNLLPAYSSGLPLHLAVRDARKKLRILENEFPCASSLPILCQNPTAPPPPTWHQLRTGGRIAGNVFEKVAAQSQSPLTISQRQSAHHQSLSWSQRLLLLLVASVVVVSIIFGLRYQTFLSPYELQSYDYLMGLRPLESQDERILLITVDDDDFEYQRQRGFAPEGHLSNEILADLLDKLADFNPRSVGLSILRPGGLEAESNSLDRQIKRYGSRLLLSCEASYSAQENSIVKGVSPPSEISPNNVGFSNFSREDIIRRQPLAALNQSLQSACTTQISFPFLLALSYLNSEAFNQSEISTFSPEKFIGNDFEFEISYSSLNPVKLNRLIGDSGGYINIGNSSYQILLSYRSLSQLEAISESISLRDILEGNVTDTAIQRLQGRLVIIGGIMPSSSDSFDTPFKKDGRRIKVKGLTLYAHMASQIISAVMDNRPLIWWWPKWLEYSWIFLWSVAGGISFLLLRRPIHLGMATSGILLALFASCHWVMNQSGWIPFVPAALGVPSTQLILLIMVHRKFKKTSSRLA